MIPTTRRLEFAAGYLALGMTAEASDELESIEGGDRLLPEVLTLRCDLHTQAKYWNLLLAVGRQLACKKTGDARGWISWAYALRDLYRVEEAKTVLVEAGPLHGAECTLLHYNLACYHGFLGDHAAALDDAGLAVMWEDIAARE